MREEVDVADTLSHEEIGVADKFSGEEVGVADKLSFEEIGVADKFFYYTSSGEEGSQNIWVSATLNVPFERTAFLKGFQDALQDYPEFACRPVISRNKLFHKPLSAPAPLVEDEKPRHFVTPETNDYPYLFRLAGNRIVFSFYHGISDVDGCWKFFMCVLEHYAKRAGYLEKSAADTSSQEEQMPSTPVCADLSAHAPQPDNSLPQTPHRDLTGEKGKVHHCKSDNDQTDTRENDPYRFFADENAIPPAKLYAGPLFIIPEKRRSDNVIKTTTVTCSLKELLSLTKSFKTSVAPFIMNAFIQAIAKTYDVGDETIVGMVAANLRQFFPTQTLRNFSDALIMTSLDTKGQTTYAEQARALRDIMKNQMSPDQFAHGFYDRVLWIEEQEASRTPLADLAKQYEQALISDKNPPFTFGLSYPGKLEPTETLKDFIIETGFGGNTGLLYAAGFHSYNDTFSLGISQRFESMKLTEAVITELRETGLTLTEPVVSETVADCLLTEELSHV